MKVYKRQEHRDDNFIELLDVHCKHHAIIARRGSDLYTANSKGNLVDLYTGQDTGRSFYSSFDELDEAYVFTSATEFYHQIQILIDKILGNTVTTDGKDVSKVDPHITKLAQTEKEGW